MSCYLAGELLIGGLIEQNINNSSIDLCITATSLTASQVSACSGSCNSTGVRVSCQDSCGQNFLGSCSKCCCLSSGCRVDLTSCSKV